MPDADKLTPASPEDLADALAFALRYEARKRVVAVDKQSFIMSKASMKKKATQNASIAARVRATCPAILAP